MSRSIRDERPDRYETSLHSDPARVSSRSRRVSGGAPRTYSGGEVPEEESTVVGFDIHGDVTSDESSLVAKRVVIAGQDDRCYVLASTIGHEVGRLLNPYGIYFRGEDVGASNAKTGRDRYAFKRVPPVAFDEYVYFLRTRVESHLRNAERQVLDA